MHVLFVEPSFPFNQRQFVRALHSVGARVTGIGETSPEHLNPEVRGWLHGYEQVSSVVNEEALYDAVRRIQRREWVDRIEASVEAHIMSTAKVREACGIPGTTVRTAWLCRDKPSMKEALRAAGVPCAQSTGADSPHACLAFAEQVGFPLILKPRAGAGASGAVRVDNVAELEAAIHENGVDQGASVAIEEFIEGHEGFYDTMSAGGHVVHDFISHYYPNVLDAMRSRWISPQVVTTNRVDAPGYNDLKQMGARVIDALGIGTSATHMEWFYGPKGLKFSEIGCRPPGVGVWDLYSAANDSDLYREWAMCIVHDRPGQPPSRNFAAGMIALRPNRDGRITGYDGVDRVFRELQPWIIDGHFPPPGSRTQGVEGGYMAKRLLRMKHPNYDQLRAMLDHVGQTIKVYAS